jgi:hypothetical protein
MYGVCLLCSVFKIIFQNIMIAVRPSPAKTRNEASDDSGKADC